MRILLGLTATVLLLSGVPEARAQQTVLFTDGRSMRAQSVELDGAHAVLTLEGGGRISFPAARIARTEAVRVKPARQAVRRSEAWRSAAGPYAELISRAAERHGLDPALLTAMAEVESAFDAEAVSPKGACGLLQLMPATAERFGVRDVFDAGQNVEGGARYMSWLLTRFEGRTDLALAGYNAGEGAVDRHRGIPPYRETRNYVQRVLAGADQLARLER